MAFAYQLSDGKVLAISQNPVVVFFCSRYSFRLCTIFLGFCSNRDRHYPKLLALRRVQGVSRTAFPREPSHILFDHIRCVQHSSDGASSLAIGMLMSQAGESVNQHTCRALQCTHLGSFPR